MNKIVRMPFRQAVLSTAVGTTVTANTNEIDLIPANLGTRMADLSVDWEKYRVTELKVQAFATSQGVHSATATYSTAELGSSMVAVGLDLSPSALTSVVNGFAPMSQLAHYDASPGTQKVAISLGRRELLGQNPVQWFDTTATGSPNDEFRYQGTVHWLTFNPDVPSGVNHYTHILLSGMIEFCQPADPNDTLALQSKLERTARRLKELQMSSAFVPQVKTAALLRDVSHASRHYAGEQKSAPVVNGDPEFVEVPNRLGRR